MVPPPLSPSERPPLCSPLSCVVTYCHCFGESSLPGEFIVYFQTSPCLGAGPGSTVAFLHHKCRLSRAGEDVQDEFLCNKAQWWCRFGARADTQEVLNSYKHICALPGWSGVIQMTGHRCYTKRASEVSVDSGETVLFIIPPAYCSTGSYHQISLPVKI